MQYTPSLATGLNCLSSTTLSDGSGNSLPPITFEWQSTTPSIDTSQSTSELLNESTLAKTLPADLNGDGVTDIVQIYLNDQILCATTFTASQSSGAITYSSSGSYKLGYYADYDVFCGDVNGDGKSELIVVYEVDECLCIDVYFLTGDSTAPSLTTNTGDKWQGKASVNFYLADVDGDGRADIIQAFQGSSGDLTLNTYLSQIVDTSGSFAESVTTKTNHEAPTSAAVDLLWAIDVNGDGMVDMVLFSKYSEGLLSCKSFVTTQSVEGLSIFASVFDSDLQVSTEHQIRLFPADVNGDGQMDIVQVSYDPIEGTSIQTFFSMSNGQFSPGPQSKFAEQIIEQNACYPLGLNGGLQTSIISCWIDATSSWNYTLFNSTSDGHFLVIGSTDTQQTFPSLNFFAGDPTGAGKAGLYYTYIDTNGCMLLQPFPSAGPFPDLVERVTDMLGNTTTIAYLPLSNAEVYTDGLHRYPKASARRYASHLSPAQYPIQPVIGKATYVVSSFKVSNHSAINRFPCSQHYRMHYSNARIDFDGRGWQGFERIDRLDTSTGLRNISTYLQEFPFTGSLISTMTEADGAYSRDAKVPEDDHHVLMSLSLYTYQQVSHAGYQNAVSYEVQRTGCISYTYDYGKSNFDYAWSKSFEYDGYGNPSLEVWWGYIEYIDPNTVKSLETFPSVTPLNISEVVHTYCMFQNDVFPNGGWALGYLLFHKESANDSGDEIPTFCTGDYNLTAITYVPGTYNLATKSHWDEGNRCFLQTSFGYDAKGNLTSVTKPGNFTTSYQYETTYNQYVELKTSPANASNISLVTRHAFDPRFGVEVATLDENGFVHLLALDSFGRKIATQGPVPAGCSQSDTNLVTEWATGCYSFSDAKVLTLESLSYLDDGQGGIYREISSLESFPDGITRNLLWDREYVDCLARRTQAVIQTDQGAGHTFVLTAYDPCGHVSSKSLPFFSPTSIDPVPSHVVQHTYDVLGRLLTSVYPGGEDGLQSGTNVRSYAGGQQVMSTDAFGSKEEYSQVNTSHFYNGKLRQTSSVVASDGKATTTLTFDAVGRMVATTDPIGIVNTVTYDSLNRVVTYDNPDQNTTGTPGVNALTYVYDSSTGNLKTITDASNSVTSYNYDNLGRLTGHANSADGRVVNFYYDNHSGQSTNGLGLLSQADVLQNGTLVVRRLHSYDCYRNRILESIAFESNVKPFVTISAFDAKRRLVSQTYPNGTRLTKVYSGGVLTGQSLQGIDLSYPLQSYTASGIPQSINYGTAANSSYTFSPLGLLYTEELTLFDNSVETPLLDYSFAYDSLHQLLSSSEGVSGETSQFTYENRRLSTAVVPEFDAVSMSYSYDQAGNILVKNGTRQYEYDAHFAAKITSGDDTVFLATQDDCGRTRTRSYGSTTAEFSYDGFGNLMRAKSGTSILSEIVLDEFGCRALEVASGDVLTFYISPAYQVELRGRGDAFEVTTTQYVLDSTGPIACIKSNDAGSEVVYFRRNHKGNVTHAFDGDGSLKGVVAYDGFGTPNVIAGNIIGGRYYEGKTWNSEIGLYCFGSRYYDPVLGRFLTPDSQLGGVNFTNPDVWNRFAFELNNPSLHVDPTGHFSLWANIGIGIGLIALTVAGIALTVATGGASDAAVAAIDGGVAGSAAPAEMAGVGVAGAGAASSGAATAGESVAAVVARVGIGITLGGIGGGATGAGMSGLTYIWAAGPSASSKALQESMLSGFGSGAVGGAITAGFGGPLSKIFLRSYFRASILGLGLVGAGAGFAATVTGQEVAKHQFPSTRELVTGIVSSMVSGMVSGASSGFLSKGRMGEYYSIEGTKMTRLSLVANKMMDRVLEQKSRLAVAGAVGSIAVPTIWGAAYYLGHND